MLKVYIQVTRKKRRAPMPAASYRTGMMVATLMKVKKSMRIAKIRMVKKKKRRHKSVSVTILAFSDDKCDIVIIVMMQKEKRRKGLKLVSCIDSCLF